MIKTETIIVRVTNEMKAGLEQLAEESRRTVSDYLRLLFETVIKEKRKI